MESCEYSSAFTAKAAPAAALNTDSKVCKELRPSLAGLAVPSSHLHAWSRKTSAQTPHDGGYADANIRARQQSPSNRKIDNRACYCATQLGTVSTRQRLSGAYAGPPSGLLIELMNKLVNQSVPYINGAACGAVFTSPYRSPHSRQRIAVHKVLSSHPI